MLRRSLLVSICALASLAAAPKPDFSGEWKLDKSKSDFGPMPVPELFERNIVHRDPSLQVTTTQTTPQGPLTITAKHTTDGKPSTNTLKGGGDVKSTLSWLGEKLVIDSNLSVQGMDVKSKETWTLSEDRKQLFVDSQLTTPQGDFKLKLVLDRVKK